MCPTIYQIGFSTAPMIERRLELGATSEKTTHTPRLPLFCSRRDVKWCLQTPVYVHRIEKRFELVFICRVRQYTGAGPCRIIIRIMYCIMYNTYCILRPRRVSLLIAERTHPPAVATKARCPRSEQPIPVAVNMSQELGDDEDMQARLASLQQEIEEKMKGQQRQHNDDSWYRWCP